PLLLESFMDAIGNPSDCVIVPGDAVGVTVIVKQLFSRRWKVHTRAYAFLLSRCRTCLYIAREQYAVTAYHADLERHGNILAGRIFPIVRNSPRHGFWNKIRLF